MHLMSFRAGSSDSICKQVSMRKVGLACAVTNADVATITQHTAAFFRHNDGISEMMVEHRHEHYVRTAVGEWQRLCRRAEQNDAAGRPFEASLIQHPL
jgi:hypothetical protein